MRAHVLVIAVLASAASADPIAVDKAATILGNDKPPAACVADEAPIECMIQLAYPKDAKARALALALFHDTGDVAGVGETQDMDGGFRGTIHLVPEWAIGRYRRHLAWTRAAFADYDDFFAKLFPADVAQPRYRWRELEVKFVRSVKKHTPSAFAMPWQVEINVEGSLLVSADRVRETLFHEIFHMNDSDHHDWSDVLRTDYDAIVAKCGVDTKCLTPYAPSDTKVRGGTYYAFTQNNGDPVHEYAAELALRYYREQREMLKRKKLSRKAFKCGPAENARAWDALVTEFFAGRDLVPPCKT